MPRTSPKTERPRAPPFSYCVNTMKLLHSKTWIEPLVVATMCEKMDVVALATKNKIMLHNTQSFQRLFMLDTLHEVTTLSWSPNGKLLVAGFSNGDVHLYQVEDGQCIVEFKAATPDVSSSSTCLHCHTAPITGLYWVDARLPVGALDRAEGVLLSIEQLLPPVPNVYSTGTARCSLSGAPACICPQKQLFRQFVCVCGMTRHTELFGTTLIALCCSLFLTHHMPYHVLVPFPMEHTFLLAWLYTRSFLVLSIISPSGVRMRDHFMLFL